MLFYDRTDHEDYRLVPSGAPCGGVCGKLMKAMAVAVAVFVHQAERLRGDCVVIAWCGVVWCVIAGYIRTLYRL